MEKSGKCENFSRSAKSQAVFQNGQGNFKYYESWGKVREFHDFSFGRFICPFEVFENADFFSDFLDIIEN